MFVRTVTTCLAPLVRVLVTGHRGLIGRATTAELTARGHTVVGFDLVDGDDIHDTVAVDRAIQNCEAVVHLAALDEPVADPADAHLGPASVGTDAQVLETNVSARATSCGPPRNTPSLESSS